MMSSTQTLIRLHQTRSGQAHVAWLAAGGLRLPCRIGRGGITHAKREGDGKTPAGTLRILRGFYRNDRRLPPRTTVPMRPSRRTDGWCDAPGHGAYNRLVRLPFAQSHETMMRDDAVYDVVLELDWNHKPRRQGRGSAIFLHLMNTQKGATAGCIAVEARHIDRLMRVLSRRTRIIIP